MAGLINTANVAERVRGDGATFGIAAILASLLVTTCAAQDRSIVVGAMYNLSGAQRDLDTAASEGVRLAVDEVNAAGGVLGRRVKLVLIDGQTRPEIISAEAMNLFSREPDLAGVIGFSDTDMVLAAAPIVARQKQVFLTSGATSPLLPRQVPDYLFLACFADNIQAAAGAQWAYNTLNARTAVVLYNETTSYARLLRGYFETSFGELGGRVLVAQPYVLDDVKTKLGKLPKADLIYLAAMPEDVATIVPTLRDAGFAAPILGGDGLDIGDAWRRVRDPSNVFFTTHAYLGADNPDPRVKNFRAAYSRAYPNGTPGAFAALGYDGARLLTAAIKSAGGTQHDAVRDALARITGFEAVTGTISYHDGSRIPVKPVSIISVEQGREQDRGRVLPNKIPKP